MQVKLFESINDIDLLEEKINSWLKENEDKYKIVETEVSSDSYTCEYDNWNIDCGRTTDHVTRTKYIGKIVYKNKKKSGD